MSAIRKCIICEARVRNQNPSPKIDTCDSVCRGAKESGRTRAEQFRVEMEAEDRQFWDSIKNN